MTIQRMIELLEIEHECMLRQSHDVCDCKCADCELAQDDYELDEMYIDVITLLKAQVHLPRLLSAAEMQNLPDRETVCVEQLISREDEERGYITGKAWGVSCNRTGASDGGLLVSMLGTFFPNTITRIPYKALREKSSGKGRVTTLYRFWTDRPTDEQSKEVKWDG